MTTSSKTYHKLWTVLKTLQDNSALPTFFVKKTTSVIVPSVLETLGTLGGLVSSTATNASTVETITLVMNLDCDDLFGWSSECDDPAFLSELNEELMRMSELVEPPKPVQPLHMRYAIPKTDEEVTKARAESVPKKTRDDTRADYNGRPSAVCRVKRLSLIHI